MELCGERSHCSPRRFLAERVNCPIVVRGQAVPGQDVDALGSSGDDEVEDAAPDVGGELRGAIVRRGHTRSLGACEGYFKRSYNPKYLVIVVLKRSCQTWATNPLGSTRMDATTIYSLALFLHIAGVLGLFAGLTIEGIALQGLRHARTGYEARTWLGLLRPLRVIGPAALALILLPGFFLRGNTTPG